MIHKRYKPNGTPDLRAWMVECDICHTRHSLSYTTEWLIPINEEMRDYCPTCLTRQAAVFIYRAIRCPACGNADIRMRAANPAYYACCANCTALIYGADVPGSKDGWVITLPPF